MASASATCAPRSANIFATVDLPQATPPVRPTFSIRSAPALTLWPAPHLARLYRVSHKHGNGQRPHSAGDWRNRARDGSDMRIDVPHQGRTFLGKRLFPRRVTGKELLKLTAVGNFIDANIDHGGAGLHKLFSHKASLADRRHKNVRLAGSIRDVPGLGVAYCDRGRGVVIKQQHGYRLTHNVAPADDHGIAPFNGDVAAAKNLNHTCRSARHQPRALGGKIADVYGMKSVTVFLRRHREQE